MTDHNQPRAYLNRITTAMPTHDVHRQFVTYAPSLLPDPQQRALYQRMVNRSQIEHRYSVLPAGTTSGQLDAAGFYKPGNFPTTQQRMALYQQEAFPLAQQALDLLQLSQQATRITHLLVTSCTGFYAPGLDLDIIAHYGLSPAVERTQIGFMGCYAAINALKLARHIVRSDAAACVLIVNLELCTLHLQETQALEELLSFTIFADGCAASLVSAEPTGLELQSFHAAILPDSAAHITWAIGDLGFDMVLSGQVAPGLATHLPAQLPAILNHQTPEAISFWAIHPGGRSILDAVEASCQLSPQALSDARTVLRTYGNMSSATIMFVLKAMLDSDQTGAGCAMAFGPGVMAETMLFQKSAA